MKTSVKSLLVHDRQNFTIKFIKANYLKVGHDGDREFVRIHGIKF